MGHQDTEMGLILEALKEWRDARLAIMNSKGLEEISVKEKWTRLANAECELAKLASDLD